MMICKRPVPQDDHLQDHLRATPDDDNNISKNIVNNNNTKKKNNNNYNNNDDNNNNRGDGGVTRVTGVTRGDGTERGEEILANWPTHQSKDLKNNKVKQIFQAGMFRAATFCFGTGHFALKLPIEALLMLSGLFFEGQGSAQWAKGPAICEAPCRGCLEAQIVRTVGQGRDLPAWQCQGEVAP